jgi:AcrR family transcriptional regulator
MPPRDEQDFEGRRQQIIDAALQVFASKGFEKATNKDIAAASGISSPALIYHYFKDKNDLFCQVLEQRLSVLQLLIHNEEEIMSKPPQDALTIFARMFLTTLENPQSTELMKLMLSEVFRRNDVAERLNSSGPSRAIAFLTRYLQAQMAVGILKPLNPAAASHCFIGSLIAYILGQEIFLQRDVQQINSDAIVATAVEVFLQGIHISVSDNTIFT